MKKILAFGELLLNPGRAGQKLFGAPAVFSWYARQLGLRPCIVSSVGKDETGRRLIGELRTRGFDMSYIDAASPGATGILKTGNETEGAQYDIPAPAAFDMIEMNPLTAQLAREADVIYFNTLGQRGKTSRETLFEIFDAAKPGALKIFDINLRGRYYTRAIVEESLKISDIFKISFEELPAFANLFYLEGETEEICSQILDKYGFKAVVLTESCDGSTIFTSGGATHSGGVPVEIFEDGSGAADAFSAVFIDGWLKGLPADIIGEAANKVASYVCGQPGPMTVLPPPLMSVLK